MPDFTITINGQVLDNGGGMISWLYTAEDGMQYGDHMKLQDYAGEYGEAVPMIAEQAAQLLNELYGGADN